MPAEKRIPQSHALAHARTRSRCFACLGHRSRLPSRSSLREADAHEGRDTPSACVRAHGKWRRGTHVRRLCFDRRPLTKFTHITRSLLTAKMARLMIKGTLQNTTRTLEGNIRTQHTCRLAVKKAHVMIMFFLRALSCTSTDLVPSSIRMRSSKERACSSMPSTSTLRPSI